jgi:glutamate carboxypeptidase
MGTLDLLRELVEIESPTYSPGVRTAAERMARELEALGARVEFLPGDHLRADLDGAGAPLLLLGHTDTVWPVGTLESMPFRVEDDRAYGPGAYDMKASLVLLVEAIRRAGEGRRALRVFLTADEEKGSVTGKAFLEEAAVGAAAAFVVEPPNAAGNLKTSRKGIGRFRLHVTGRAAHAADPTSGASAIDELAHQILTLKMLGDASGGVTVNIGVIHGGTAENVVAAEAVAEFDVRVPSTADRDLVDAELAALRAGTRGTDVRLEGGWTRPPLERTPESGVLFARAREHGRALGLGLHETTAAGGSDGNLVGAVGVPVLDGLGAMGAGAHALDEHVMIESIGVRAELLARLLVDPGL